MTRRIDFEQIVAYGHSLGGATAASVALADDRVLGGVDLDGSPWGPVIETGLEKPFLYSGKDLENGDDPTIIPFFEKLRGPKMMVRVDGATHYSYIDFPLLLTTQEEVPPELRLIYEYLLGTVEGERMMTIVITLLRGLFDLALRGDAQALSRVEKDFPEIHVMERDL